MTPQELSRIEKSFAHAERVLGGYPDGFKLHLIRLGTHRPDGTMHENYGGPEMSEAEKAEFAEAQAEAERVLSAWFARPENRSLELKPLDANEIRARNHLLETTGEDGGGDPVGALIAAHAALLSEKASA